MWFKNGLKVQKLLAQGIALGIMAISKAPCKGKSLMFLPGVLKLLPFQGVSTVQIKKFFRKNRLKDLVVSKDYTIFAS